MLAYSNCQITSRKKYSGADDYETTQEVDNIFSGLTGFKLGSWFGIEISPFWATALQ
jgi:hypothetical protein